LYYNNMTIDAKPLDKETNFTESLEAQENLRTSCALCPRNAEGESRTSMSHVFEAIERLKSDLAGLRTDIRILEIELARSRKTIHGLLAQDLEYSEENARLKEALSNAHRHIQYDCNCSVCKEVDQSQAESFGLWPYD
jgi:hypothetical protein